LSNDYAAADHEQNWRFYRVAKACSDSGVTNGDAEWKSASQNFLRNFLPFESLLGEEAVKGLSGL
jgi:hypothetical protein